MADWFKVGFTFNFILCNLDDILDVTSKKIEGLTNEINSYDEDDERIVELAYQIDEFLGVSFLSAHVFVTQIYSSVYRHMKNNRNFLSKEFKMKNKCKQYVLNYPTDIKTGYSEVQKINSIANTFKHSSEWDEWSEEIKERKSEFTLKLIQSIGLKEGGYGSWYRTTYKHLYGNADYSNIYKIRDSIATWGDVLQKEFDKVK